MNEFVEKNRRMTRKVKMKNLFHECDLMTWAAFGTTRRDVEEIVEVNLSVLN